MIYVTGILLADTISGKMLMIFLAFVVTGAFLTVFLVIFHSIRWFYPMTILLFLLFPVLRYLQVHDHSGHEITKDQLRLENVTFEFKLTESLNDKGFLKRIGKITKTDAENTGLMGKKILLYFKGLGQPAGQEYLPGQVYSTKSHVYAIAGNSNPSTFDYKKYMHAQNIHFYAYPDTATTFSVKNERLFSPFSRFEVFRRKMLEILDNELARESSSSLVKALTLGDKGGLDTETLQTFSNTGARHVLTVSGMHVGIIMLILTFVMSPFKDSKVYFKMIRIAVLITGLWSYIFLIGPQPAVLRAGFMLSVYIAGVELYRSQNSLNTLAFSAFLLLFINPLMLFQLSFMFTYLALFSILCFYQPIYRLLRFSNKMANYFWQLTALSLAAQVLMMPVSAFYFHIAPLYFLISGIIATPAALAIFSLTILFFLEFYIFEGTSKIFAYLLDKVSGWFLDSIAMIDALPYSSLKNIWITETGLLLMILTIGLFAIALLAGKKQFLFYGLLMSIAMTLHHYIREDRLDKHQEICIYAYKNGLFIDLFINRICYSIKSDTLSIQNGDFVYGNHRMRYGIKRVINIHPDADHRDQYLIYEKGSIYLNKVKIDIHPGSIRNDTSSIYPGFHAQRDFQGQNTWSIRSDEEVGLHVLNEILTDHFSELPIALNSTIVLPMHIPPWQIKKIKKSLPEGRLIDLRNDGALRIIFQN